jgi:tetratricopeptide (TPR) repeat protein
MQPYNIAYAQAMREVAQQFPDDLDVATLTAEAMMDVKPWQLWTRDGTPAEGTKEIVALLESVLARDPNHAGANHYYIHAIEASAQPERALPSARRLAGLMPGAGHVVHMPAHIFQRVGEYETASAHNARAAEVDLAYMKKVKPPGYYPMYLAHNYGFLAYSESMRGRKEPSLRASRESAKHMPPEMLAMMPGMDFFASLPLLVMVRFGTWDELLDEPRPQPKYQVMTALWLHAHGFALAATGRIDEARAELDELLELQRELPADLRAGNNAATDLARVAAQVLEARIAQAEQRPEALGLWAEAVALGDQLGYSEPADWFYPIRHYHGAALLETRKYAEAESVYREDLRHNPRNGWALFGLWKSLEGQGKVGETAAAKAAFDEAWKDADIELTSTAF